MTDQQLVFALPAAGLALTAFLYLRTRRFLARAARARGTVVSFDVSESEQWRGEGQGSETVTTYHAQVRFTLPDGSTVEFRSGGLSRRPGIGAGLKVAYDPERPQETARIDDGTVWQSTVVSGCLTAFVIAFAAWSWLSGDSRGATAARPAIVMMLGVAATS